MDQIPRKFRSMIRMRFAKSHFDLVHHNSDYIFLSEISDLHKQDLHDGEIEVWKTISDGIAHKNSKSWAYTFRLYNSLKYINKSHMNVLDLGCDTGFMRYMIHRGTYVSNTNYVGVDIRSTVLYKAAERIKRCNNPAVFFNADLQKGLPFIRSGSIDFMYAMEVIEHLEQETAQYVLSEIYRVLRDDAFMYCTMPRFLETDKWNTAKKHRDTGYPFHLKEYTIDEFRKMCRKANLRIISYYSWMSRRKDILSLMDVHTLEVYNLLCNIMGNQIPTQIFGQLFPEVGGSITYIIARR